MRTLSATLLAAQQAATRTPYVEVEASNRISGLVRLDWERLYAGAEDDYYHALTMPGDGSMVRARITLPADSRKLYRQRVASPGAGSDFGTWVYTGQYNCVVAAVASCGSEVSVFWTNTSREVRRIKSTDHGASWGSPELIDYSPTTAINGLAAAYKTNGDLAIFFADQSTLYVKKRVSGTWQSKAAWDKATGILSGVGTVYDGDWNLLVTGKDASGNFKLWSLVYGDGDAIPAGTWSPLRELASASATGSFDYVQPFLDKPDVFRCFFTERFSGTQAYNRPFWSHSTPETTFPESLWREPVPFNLSAQYGLALAHAGACCWLSAPFGVWRASLAVQSLELTGEVLSLVTDTEERLGRLKIDLRNDDGRYSSLPSPLACGCQLDVSPGCVTRAGNEVSSGQTFVLESCEHTSAGGKASLVLNGRDGWGDIASWTARHQFRWNKSGSEKSVKEILAFVLARCGLKLETKSESASMTGYYPDFTISPGDRGDAVVERLLSFVPDLLFVEGAKAYLVNPQSSDPSAYSYGASHAVLAAQYGAAVWEVDRVQVEGRDPATGQLIVADTFDWTQVDESYDRLARVEDRNLDNLVKAQQRGDTLLRKAGMASTVGEIRIPVNCGQQMYDVIDVTDLQACLSAAKKRVTSITLYFQPAKGRYEMRVGLGGV